MLLYHTAVTASQTTAFFDHKREHSVLVRFEVFTAMTMKNGVFWDVALVRTDVSEEPPPSSGRQESVN
jgi:hypothetical protein